MATNPTPFRVLAHETLNLLVQRHIRSTREDITSFPSYNPETIYIAASQTTISRGWSLGRVALATESELRFKWGPSFKSSESDGPCARWDKKWDGFLSTGMAKTLHDIPGAPPHHPHPARVIALIYQSYPVTRLPSRSRLDHLLTISPSHPLL